MRVLITTAAGIGFYRNIYYDDADPTLISFKDFIWGSPDPEPYPTYAEGDPIGSPVCQGTTKYSYFYTSVAPAATYTAELNSLYCGFVPPFCDLTVKSVTVTDETDYHANDGTINIFAISSRGPISYYNVFLGPSFTGYYIGVAPGTYTFLITDGNGCTQSATATIQAFDPNKTRFKYRLGFKGVKTGQYWELRLLDQKHQYDATLYPKDLTGTNSPVVRKSTNSNEDKTEGIIVSSLLINAYADGNTFQVSEFADAAERDWKVELWKGNANQTGKSVFNLDLNEQFSPFIDGNILLKQNGIEVLDFIFSGTTLYTGIVGQSFTITAHTDIASTDPNPKMTMIIEKNGEVVFQKTINATLGALMSYTGFNDLNSVYDITVFTQSGGTVLPLINIDDSINYGKFLDWQGWLLPDELQDLYADPEYTVQLTATDGLLSLQGSTFGDPTLFQLDQYGNKILNQLFGLQKWVYLVKICLDQLGYDYGETTLISSLTYIGYSDQQWINYVTWADIFYDENGVPKDTYSALQLLLQGMHVQILQHQGGFVIWDISDVYYTNNMLVPIKPYCFVFNADFTAVSTSTNIPKTINVGYNLSSKPINPPQTLNYDKAFNTLEADVNFNLLSLLYPNPSFEFNSVEGGLPEGMSKVGTINAFTHYDPQTNIINSGAYLGSWEVKAKQNWPVGNAYDFGNYLHLTTPITIDQDLKRLNFSYVWRAYFPLSTFPNSLPVTIITFIGIDTGIKWSWWIDVTGAGKWQVETSEPVTHTASPNVETTDYAAWNSFSITTAQFPERGGYLDIRILAPSYWFPGHDIPAGTALEVDIDDLIMTVSDTQDAYNFQTGETHIVTNLTSFAKAEKKTVDLELFTYPNNKRISGNVGDGLPYLSSNITNDWFFGLSVEQTVDRLPANIIRRIAKNYQRPMYKWQGDVSSDEIQFFAVFTILGLTNRVFIAFTTEMDLRNSTGNIVLIETDDSQMQSTYLYTPVFEKSARNNLS